MMTIIGIDPGRRGALCTLDISSGALQFYDMPILTYKSLETGKGGTLLNERELLKLIRRLSGPHIVFAIIERQQAFYKGSCSSTFKMGDDYGLLRGMILSSTIPGLETVKPRDWKKAAALVQGDVETSTQFKERSRQLALASFPSASDSLKRKSDHNRAEAALIAEYGRKYILPKYIRGYKYEPFH
jgi:hypothetical protein